MKENYLIGDIVCYKPSHFSKESDLEWGLVTSVTNHGAFVKYVRYSEQVNESLTSALTRFEDLINITSQFRDVLDEETIKNMLIMKKIKGEPLLFVCDAFISRLIVDMTDPEVFFRHLFRKSVPLCRIDAVGNSKVEFSINVLEPDDVCCNNFKVDLNTLRMAFL